MDYRFIILTFLINIIGVGSIGFLIYWLCQYHEFLVKLRKLPGPKPSLILGDLHFGFLKSGPGLPKTFGLTNIIMGISALFAKDSLVRFWLGYSPCIMINRVAAAEDILSSNVAITKSWDYNFVHTWLKFGLLTSKGEKWRSRRKMLTPSFHFRVLNDFQKVINNQCVTLVQQLNKEIGKDETEILNFVSLCSLDVICESASGVKINSQLDKSSSYVKALHTLTDIAMSRILHPQFWVENIFRMLPTGITYNNELRKVHNFTKKVIQERLHATSKDETTSFSNDLNIYGSSKKLAFLDLLIEEHRKNPNFTIDDIQEEMDTFTFEGHDTTASGISWCMFLLGHHPDIQQNIYEELMRNLGDSNYISVQDTRELKYLEMVIKESHRLYPPVPIIGRSIEEDIIIDGMLVPKGINCYVNIMSIHRDPDVYPNPEIFDPERFSYEEIAKRNPFAFVPFSAGSRNCIGQKFAMNEEKTIIANLVKNFTWTSLDPRDKVTVIIALVTRPYPGIRIKLSKRVK